MALPGVFISLESDGLFVGGFTDAAGQYSVKVTPGSWRISPDSESATPLGYVGIEDETPIDVNGNLIHNVSLSKATALVFGTVRDTQSQPVLGLRMQGENHRMQQPVGRTFGPDGAYAIGVVAGTWNVGPNQNDSSALGYLPQTASLTLQVGQALRHDFTLQHLNVTAHVSGRLVQGSPSGPGIPKVGVYACPQSPGSCLSANTGPDGSFDIGLFAGTWNVGFSDDLVQQNLVGPSFSVTVVDGVNQTLPATVVLVGTAHITGTVQDTQANAITGLGVHAWTTIGGTGYSAYIPTDSNGHFSLLVADGTWNVSIDCDGLLSRGYGCASSQIMVINHADQVVNFVVHLLVPACAGDCGGNHQVTVDEILRLVSIALGNADLSTCQAGDANSSGTITVDEILTAVNSALNGCPS